MSRIATVIMVVCLAAVPGAAQVTISSEGAAKQVSVAGDDKAAKQETTAASAEGALAAGSTESALTAESIMKKWAAAYTSAKSIYEEGHYTIVLDAPGRQNTQTLTVRAAVRKPDTLKVEMSGRGGFVVALANGEALFYNVNRNEYIKKNGQRFEDLVVSLRRFPSVAMAISPDPYALMMDGVQKAEAPKEADFDGRAAYEIGLKTATPIVITAYFDRKTMLLAGIRMEAPAGPQGGKVTTTEVIDKLLIDEMPKGADGKEADVLSFVLPEGASEYRAASPAVGADSAMPRERPVQSTDSNPSGK